MINDWIVICDRFADSAPTGPVDTEQAPGYRWSGKQTAIHNDGHGYVLMWQDTLTTPADRLIIIAVVVLLAVIGWWCVIDLGRSTDVPTSIAATVPYVVPDSAVAPPIPVAASPLAPTPTAVGALAPPLPPLTHISSDKRLLAIVTDTGTPVTDARQAVSATREVRRFLAASHCQRHVGKQMQNILTAARIGSDGVRQTGNTGVLT